MAINKIKHNVILLGAELHAICHLKVFQGMHIFIVFICKCKEEGYFSSEFVENKCNQFWESP